MDAALDRALGAAQLAGRVLDGPALDVHQENRSPLVRVPAARGAGQNWREEPGNIISEPTKVRFNPASREMVTIPLTRVIPPVEQAPRETYRHGERIKCIVVSVRKGMRGPQITLSRSHPNLVKKLFALEVPEIADGTVQIAAIAREAAAETDEAGSRRLALRVHHHRDHHGQQELDAQHAHAAQGVSEPLRGRGRRLVDPRRDGSGLDGGGADEVMLRVIAMMEGMGKK